MQEAAAAAGEAVMEPWLERLHEERAELRERIAKLAVFTSVPAFYCLADAEQERLLRQYDVMSQYLGVLVERIHAADEKPVVALPDRV
jgi:hypothetical protein